jgi:hypothetical protein
MIALLWIVNPIWQIISPLILLGIGYWLRPRVEKFLDDCDEIMPDTARKKYNKNDKDSRGRNLDDLF